MLSHYELKRCFRGLRGVDHELDSLILFFSKVVDLITGKCYSVLFCLDDEVDHSVLNLG